MRKAEVIANIEQIYNTIIYQCQEYSYYPPNSYQIIAEKIQNAASILFFDAVIMSNNKLDQGKKSNLSLSQIIELLKSINDTMSKPDVLKEKEEKIQKTLQEANLIPENFLRTDEWSGDFIEKLEQ